MKTNVYKVIDCWEPELTSQEWDHLEANFNTLGTNDTHRSCGYYGSKKNLRESLEPPEEMSDDLKAVGKFFGWSTDAKVRPSYDGLKKLLEEAEKADPNAEHLIIWNGR
jgi:hypothetical protein